MNELTTWLLAQIAADEAVARAVRVGSGRWHPHVGIDGDEEVRADGNDYVADGATKDHATHIARHDPARVLAECAAKRDVIRVCTAELAGREIQGAMDDGDDGPWLADHVLHTLASVYAGADGWREEWA